MSFYSGNLFEDALLTSAWLAANSVDKRMTKSNRNNLLSASIPKAVEAVESLTPSDSQQEKTIPLRLCSQLLYGIVRIFSGQANQLHSDVSGELKQLKAIFAQGNVLGGQETMVDLNEVVLQDKLTIENLVAGADFNIDEIFGNQAEPDTIPFEESSTADVSIGDVSVGRGQDNDYDTMSDIGDKSIDGLSRRAVQERGDDLEGVEGFDLDLNFDAMDKDNENTLGDFNVTEDFNVEPIADDYGGFDIADDEDVEMVDVGGNHPDYMATPEAEQPDILKSRRRRRRRKETISTALYTNNNVVRTKRKKLVVDNVTEKSTAEVRKSQTDFAKTLRRNRLELIPKLDGERDEEAIFEVVKSLQPQLLRYIGTTWMDIKRRKLEHSLLTPPPTAEQEFEDNEHFEAPNFDIEPMQAEQPDTFDLPEFNNEQQEEDHARVNVQEDEQQKEGEVEDYEEEEEEDFEIMRATNQSTIKIAESIRSHDKNVTFDTLEAQGTLSSNKKKNATRTFFELLVLATSNSVKLEQERLFGDIKVLGTVSLESTFL